MNLHSANNKFWESINDFVSGGGDGGYKCVERLLPLTEENVTTVDDGEIAVSTLTYSDFIDVDEIKVTFNGTEYTCEKNVIGEGANAYGGVSGGEHDFTEYPFAIFSANEEPSSNDFETPTAGTYQVKIETEQETVETTPCFDKAVKSLANILTVRFTLTGEATYTADKTVAEFKEVFESGGLVLFIMPPAGLLSARVDIVNFITGNQYIHMQHEDKDTPNYVIEGENIKVHLD